jgi:hypothetical protein
MSVNKNTTMIEGIDKAINYLQQLKDLHSDDKPKELHDIDEKIDDLVRTGNRPKCIIIPEELYGKLIPFFDLNEMADAFYKGYKCKCCQAEGIFDDESMIIGV